MLSSGNLFRRLETCSELVNFLRHDIGQSIWHTQKGGMTRLELQDFPGNSAAADEQVLREWRESLVLGCVHVDATAVVRGVVVVNRSARRIE